MCPVKGPVPNHYRTCPNSCSEVSQIHQSYLFLKCNKQLAFKTVQKWTKFVYILNLCFLNIRLKLQSLTLAFSWWWLHLRMKLYNLSNNFNIKSLLWRSGKTKTLSLNDIIIIMLGIVHRYIKVPLIRPPMVLVKNGLSSEPVSVMRPVYIEKCILLLKQVVS